MMKRFSVFIPCLPPSTTAQQHKRIFRTKDGRAFLATDHAGQKIQTQLCALLAANAPEKDFPRDLPVFVRVRMFFPYRKSERKSVVRAGDVLPHTSRPDVDNLVKFLFDCMTRCNFWNDDSQIFSALIEKFYAQEPGIQIDVTAYDAHAKITHPCRYVVPQEPQEEPLPRT